MRYYDDAGVLTISIFPDEGNSTFNLNTEEAQKGNEACILKLECVFTLVWISQMLDHQLVILVVLVHTAQDWIVYKVLGLCLYFVAKLLTTLL